MYNILCPETINFSSHSCIQLGEPDSIPGRLFNQCLPLQKAGTQPCNLHLIGDSQIYAQWEKWRYSNVRCILQTQYMPAYAWLFTSLYPVLAVLWCFCTHECWGGLEIYFVILKKKITHLRSGIWNVACSQNKTC